MTLEFTLDAALSRVATIGECHWTKGWFAAGRLVSRLPGLRGPIELAVLQSDWNEAPQSVHAIADHLVPSERFAPARALRLMARGLFPAAYLAAHDWVAQSRTPAEGFARLVEEARERAVNESGHLGHGFSIWAGYADLADSGLLEEAPNRSRRATERFAEYYAQALPGYPVGSNDWSPPPYGDATPRALPHVLDEVLAAPGFFGHNVILLSHVLRYRARLTDRQWYRLLAQAEGSARESAQEAAQEDVRSGKVAEKIRRGSAENAALGGVGQDGEPEQDPSADLEATIARHLRRKPGNVHRITLSDAVLTLWAVAKPAQQRALLALLENL